MKLTTHLIFTVPPDFFPSCSVRLKGLTGVFATFLPVIRRPRSLRLFLSESGRYFLPLSCSVFLQRGRCPPSRAQPRSWLLLRYVDARRHAISLVGYLFQ